MSKIFTIFASCLLLCLGSCGGEKTTFEFMPNMMDQPSVKAQEEAPRLPVAGTIARGALPYPYAQDEGDQAGQELVNPLPLTRNVMLHGQAVFNTYCLVCHGPRGQGDGPVIPKFPRPPTLTSEKVTTWSDGRIFHVITMGQNLMPSYASQVPREDRWAAIHYLRVLQRAEHPTAEDIEQLWNWH